MIEFLQSAGWWSAIVLWHFIVLFFGGVVMEETRSPQGQIVIVLMLTFVICGAWGLF